jgi:Mn-dependent DtxR family transcriptional regulator
MTGDLRSITDGEWQTMIKDLLKHISLGNLTFNEMARRLKIGRCELKDRLEMMERMGYIQRVQGAANTDGGAACALCSMANGCPKANAGEQKTMGYFLTDKGKRACLL